MAGQSLPRSGHVSQLRANWSVFEDEALATRIQHEEIDHHYKGNKIRNQQIRADIPQAKDIQSSEILDAEQRMELYRQQLNDQAEADSRLAVQLALGHRSPLADDDEEYRRRRDEVFARNIHQLSNRYKARNQTQGAGAGESVSQLEYNDDAYKVKVARPAVVTDEPVYANNEEEKIMSRVPAVGQPGGHRLPPLNRLNDPEPPLPARAAAAEPQQHLTPRSSRQETEICLPAAHRSNVNANVIQQQQQQHDQYPQYQQQQPQSYQHQYHHQPLQKQQQHQQQHQPLWSNETEVLGAVSLSYAGGTSRPRRPPDDLNTSSDCGPSSRTSERSGSSMTSYSDLGACGGGPSLGDTPDEFQDILGIRSALSPAELAAAEAAEKLHEQEKLDAALALRLQEQLEVGDDGDEMDRRMAVEAQDREFARVLQAKEKARARRAKEKARQRKAERQRAEELQRQMAEADTVQVVESDTEEGEVERSPRGAVVTGATTNTSPRDQQNPLDSRISPRSPDMIPPARKPYVHTEAIDSHLNDTFCKTQITPQLSSNSDTSEPQYANLDERGQPLKTEPILHLPSSKSCDKISPRQSVLNEDMPTPPYMPMQSSASRKSESMERKIMKKKEKEGCKQQ